VNKTSYSTKNIVGISHAEFHVTINPLFAADNKES
jgi:hypothetical protein